MWCPEGYITLEEIINGFYLDTDRIASATDRPDLNSDLESPAIDVGIDSVEQKAFINWLSSRLFRIFHHDFRVCTSTGVPLRLSYRAFEGRIGRFGLGSVEVRSDFPGDYETRSRIAGWTFFAIDLWNGAIRRDLDTTYSDFAPLSGLPVCIKVSDLPVPALDLGLWLMEHAADPYASDPEPESGSKGGRPSLHPEIISAFEQVYQNGMAGTSLIKVADRLGYNRKTVRAALIAAGHYRSG